MIVSRTAKYALRTSAETGGNDVALCCVVLRCPALCCGVLWQARLASVFVFSIIANEVLFFLFLFLFSFSPLPWLLEIAFEDSIYPLI